MSLVPSQPPVYTDEQFRKAIVDSGGNYGLIAVRVGCSRGTAQRRIASSPELTEAFTDEAEGIVDLAESIILTTLRAIEAKQKETPDVVVDTSDVKWFLQRKGKERGYTERQELAGPGGDAIPISIIKMSMDAL